jgi:hypothetical protein
MAGKGDAFMPFFALEIAEPNVVVFGDSVEDLLDGDAFFIRRAGLTEGGLGQIEIDPPILEHAHPLDFGDSAFELSSVVFNLGGNVADDIVRQR